MRAVLSRDDVFAMDGSERVAMGVRSPAFVPRPSLKPAPLAAGLAREGERSAFGEAFGARLEAASLEVDGLAVSRGGNLLFSDVRFAVEPGQIMALTGKNGVGKTSLAQVAVGLGRTDEGLSIIHIFERGEEPVPCEHVARHTHAHQRHRGHDEDRTGKRLSLIHILSTST